MDSDAEDTFPLSPCAGSSALCSHSVCLPGYLLLQVVSNKLTLLPCHIETLTNMQENEECETLCYNTGELVLNCDCTKGSLHRLLLCNITKFIMSWVHTLGPLKVFICKGVMPAVN